MSQTEAETPESKPARKSRKGCFVLGCLGSAALAIVLAAIVYFGFDYIVDKSVNTFTDEKPLDIEALREQRFLEIQARDADSTATVKDAGGPSLEPSLLSPSTAESENSSDASQENTNASTDSNIIEMDEEEFNAFIAISPEFADIKDNVYLVVEGNDLFADVSYPLDEFADVPLLSGLKGRYFNGRVQLYLEKADDELEVRVTGAESKGEAIPKNLLDQLSKYNLAEKYNNDPEAHKLLNSIKSIRVENGKVRLEFK